MNFTTSTLCRDCYSKNGSIHSAYQKPRCGSCGSPRLLIHEELFSLSIAHIDCDAFFATIEKRDNPDLNDHPVIVGGGKRGVVSTCCYIARQYGIHSAMPMFKARQLCPHAIIIKPNMKKYATISRTIRQFMQTLTPLVQPLSIDEAFLDLSGTQRLHGSSSAETLARFATRIEHQIGITVSIGLSHNKFLAKFATDLQKPRGFTIIGKRETISFLKDLPVSKIWGVGQNFQKKLSKDGIYTIGELQTINELELAKRYGAIGLRLFKLSKGIDERPVKTQRTVKSVSAERTFDKDYATGEELLPVLRKLCEKVSSRLKQNEIAGKTITLKLKTHNFKIRTRSYSLKYPTQLSDRIFSKVKQILQVQLDGTKFRLIGVSVSELHNKKFSDPDDLLDTTGHKRRAIELAIDEIRKQFGPDIVHYGLTFQRKNQCNK